MFHPSPQGTVDNASGLGLAGGAGHGVRSLAAFPRVSLMRRGRPVCREEALRACFRALDGGTLSCQGLLEVDGSAGLQA